MIHYADSYIIKSMSKILCYCLVCSWSIRDKRLSWQSAIAW